MTSNTAIHKQRAIPEYQAPHVQPTEPRACFCCRKEGSNHLLVVAYYQFALCKDCLSKLKDSLEGRP